MRIKLWAAGAVVTLASAGLVTTGVGASASGGWTGSTGRGWPVVASSTPEAQAITTGRTIKLNGRQRLHVGGPRGVDLTLNLIP